MRKTAYYRGFFEDEFMTISLRPNGVVLRAAAGYELTWVREINVRGNPKPMAFEDGLETFWVYKKRGVDSYQEALEAKRVWLRCVNMHLAGVLWVRDFSGDIYEEERQATLEDRNG